MRVRLWSTAPDGTAQTIAELPLQDGQPSDTDTIRIRMSDGWLIYRSINRSWVIEPNPNGGGATVSLNVQVTQIGAIPDEPEGDPGDPDGAAGGAVGGTDAGGGVPGDPD